MTERARRAWMTWSVVVSATPADPEDAFLAVACVLDREVARELGWCRLIPVAPASDPHRGREECFRVAASLSGSDPFLDVARQAEDAVGAGVGGERLDWQCADFGDSL